MNKMKDNVDIILDIESRISQLENAPDDITFNKEQLIATFNIMLRDYKEV